jgi:hypothetical protein
MNNNWFNKLFINEAKPALDRHSGQAAIEPLTATGNGVYSPPEGVEGYSPVTVAIPEYEGSVTKVVSD